VPEAETRSGLPVLHPRSPVLPKPGMSVAPMLLLARVSGTAATSARERCLRLDRRPHYPDGVAAAMLARPCASPWSSSRAAADINLIAQHSLPRRIIHRAAITAAGAITVSEVLKRALVAMGVSELHIQGRSKKGFCARHARLRCGKERLRAASGIFLSIRSAPAERRRPSCRRAGSRWCPRRAASRAGASSSRSRHLRW
jgi:hypothetical protein